MTGRTAPEVLPHCCHTPSDKGGYIPSQSPKLSFTEAPGTVTDTTGHRVSSPHSPGEGAELDNRGFHDPDCPRLSMFYAVRSGLIWAACRYCQSTEVRPPA